MMSEKSKEEPKLVSITLEWDDSSSLTFAPSEWDSHVSHLIVTMMMEAAGIETNATRG